MKIKRKIYWNLCLVALLPWQYLRCLSTAPLPGSADPERQSVMTEVRYLESAMDVSGEEYLAAFKEPG